MFIRSIKHLYFEYISFITHLTWIWYCTVVYRINVFRRNAMYFSWKMWMLILILLVLFNALQFFRWIRLFTFWTKNLMCCMLTKKKNMLHQVKESLGMSSWPIEWSSYLSLNTILYDVLEYNTTSITLFEIFNQRYF